MSSRQPVNFRMGIFLDLGYIVRQFANVAVATIVYVT